MKMKLPSLYLVLAALGLILPYSQIIPYFVGQEGTMTELLQAPFSTRGVAVFGFDLTVSALAFLAWLLSEIFRSRIRHGWLPLVTLFLVGLSMALPLLLYLKEVQRGLPPKRESQSGL
jgi:hypothetical protein